MKLWAGVCGQWLIAGEAFQHILRVLNMNVDGRQKIMFALTSIQGGERQFANLVYKKADVDMSKRCVWRASWNAISDVAHGVVHGEVEGTTHSLGISFSRDGTWVEPSSIIYIT
jgi:metal-dependent amidase/aminoacylase/carboxypeptidase family protein